MQFKKLAAVAGTAIMAGMTLAGPALASTITGVGSVADMVSVTGSVPSFPLFVIGSSAATSDVAGAVDMAVNLAANAKISTSVTSSLPGESVSGGVKIATGGVPLTPYLKLQDVKGIITASDIPSILNGGTYSTASGGSYQYKQYLYMGGDDATGTAKVVFAKPTNENTPKLALLTPGAKKLYTYKLTFSTPVSLAGVTTATELKNVIQGTTLNFLGKDFVVSDCDFASNAISSLTLLGGKNIVTAETGTPQTVSIDTKDYTVALTGVAAQSVGTSTYYSAIGDVNGESFTLKAGETKTLSDGTLIAAIKVFQGKTGAPDYATIAIGADKVTMTSGPSGTVSKGTTTVSQLASTITSSVSAGWSVLKLDYTPDQDAWYSAGASIVDPFASTFNIKFNSIVPDAADTANRQAISFTPSGYNMLLTYKNAADAEKQMYTTYTNTTGTFWASADLGTVTNGDNNMRDVVFDEAQNISAIEQDYFVVQKGGFSHTMQFTTYVPSTKQYTFSDESGNSISATGSTGGIGDTADLIVDGNTFKVTLLDNTTKVINVDLNGDGTTGAALGAAYSYLVPKLITTGQGGLYFYKGTSAALSNATTTAQNAKIGLMGINLQLGATTAALKVGSTSIVTVNANAATLVPGTSDTGFIDLMTNCTAIGASWTCTVGLAKSATEMLTSPGFVLVEEARAGGTTHNWVYVPVKYSTDNSRTSVDTISSDDTNFAELNVLGTSTQWKGMTTYGTFTDHLSSSLGGSATLSYPDVFEYANVYVLSPTGTILSGGTGGAVTTDRILPITADVVKLDSEVTSSDKQNNDLIVVGGPCINTVAAAVLDKTFPACGAASGIPTNAALIKVVADKFATGKSVLLVAGWEAADSDLAARIVQTGFPGATTAQKAAAELTVTGTVASPSYS